MHLKNGNFNYGNTNLLVLERNSFFFISIRTEQEGGEYVNFYTYNYEGKFDKENKKKTQNILFSQKLDIDATRWGIAISFDYSYYPKHFLVVAAYLSEMIILFGTRFLKNILLANLNYIFFSFYYKA